MTCAQHYLASTIETLLLSLTLLDLTNNLGCTPCEVQFFKFGEVAQFGRYLPAQPVLCEIQFNHATAIVGGTPCQLLSGSSLSQLRCASSWRRRWRYRARPAQPCPG